MWGGGGIQKELYSCSMFAFDHCVQLGSTNPGFHTEIRRDSFMESDQENDRMLYWDKLPPNFIWNVQSRKILQEYEKIKPEEELTLRMPNGMSYREYIDRGICTYVDEEEGREVTRNESINVTVLHKVIEDIGAQLGALGVGVTEVGTINYRHIP